MKRFALGLCALLLLSPLRAATPTDLEVRQPIAQEAGHYAAEPGIHIAFTLDAPAEVTVEIAAHLAVAERSSPYLAKPPVIRTIKAGTLPAGRQEIVWDGLAENGQPVIQQYLRKKKALLDEAEKNGRPPTAAELIGQVPINLFEIRVKAGASTISTNFLRLAGTVSDSRRAPATFDGAVSDGNGGCFVVSNRKWRAWHFNGQGNQLVEYPARPESWNGNVPAEARQIAVADDKVYVLSPGNGVLRYTLDGSDAPWPAKVDYVRGARLGVTVRKLRSGATGKLNLGGKTMSYGPEQVADLAKQPGFATDWGAMEVDGTHVYLVRNAPAPELQLFTLDGQYQQSVPVPPDTYFGARLTRQGKLWLIGPRGPKLIDPSSGTLIRSLKNPPGGSYSGMSLGLDGSLYFWNPTTLFRFTSEGEPAPFEQNGMNRLEPGVIKILSVAGDQKGNMTIFTTDETKESGPANATLSVLTFDAQGNYLPAPVPETVVGCQRPANVFVDAEPGRLALFVTSLEKEQKPAKVKWTLTDYDGAKKEGVLDFTLAPRARQVISVPLSAEQLGYYQWNAVLEVEGQAQATLSSAAARIRSRSLTVSPDSPFGTVWGRDFSLMALAGVKKERVGSTSWSTVEPFEGVIAPEVDDLNTGILAMRRQASASGVLLSEMFNYGEPWTSKGWLIQIHSFDRYFKHVLSLVDRVGDAGVDHFQFWNEPNNFWKLPGPFSREHYSVVAKNCWSIVKARAKETDFICDGDATTFGMMQDLADAGAAPFNDAVECHYLGASSVTINAMRNSTPETKVASLEGLSKLRDRFYPGKPILDTEEGIWGDRGLSLAEGARVIPRVYIPLLAAGLDQLDWFRFAGAADDRHSSYPLNDRELPQPAYCSYASMTRALEGAEPIGRIDLKDPDVYAYLFVRECVAIVPMWTVKDGEVSVDLPFEISSGNLVDMMDRPKEGSGSSLKLSKNIQYLTFPVNSWVGEQIRAALKQQLGRVKLSDPANLGKELAATAEKALSDPAAMTRLYYLAKASRLLALPGVDLKVNPPASCSVAEARKEILRREGEDGYLAQSRLVLSWAERMERAAKPQPAGWVAELARSIAGREQPRFPGVALNAFIGEPGEIEKIRATEVKAPDFPLVDPQFRYEIPRKPGQTVSLELSVWNYYRHPISGKILPRLPQGWAARTAGQDFTVQPGEFTRVMFEVTIPEQAEPGRYPLGGTVLYAGHEIAELHAQRVKLEK